MNDNDKTDQDLSVKLVGRICAATPEALGDAMGELLWRIRANELEQGRLTTVNAQTFLITAYYNNGAVSAEGRE